MKVAPAIPETEQNDAPQSTVAKGMVLMIIAMLMLPIMDGIAKLLTLEYDVSAGQTTFGRFLVQASLLGPIIIVGIFTFAVSLVVWIILKGTMGIRVDEEAEINGLDMAELGMEAYPDFTQR